jgi:hypothetical protein
MTEYMIMKTNLTSLVLVLMVAALAACSKNDDSLSDAAVVNSGDAVEEAVIEVAAGTEAAEEAAEGAAEEAVEGAAEEAVEEIVEEAAEETIEEIVEEAAEETVEEAAEETEGSGE